MRDLYAYIQSDRRTWLNWHHSSRWLFKHSIYSLSLSSAFVVHYKSHQHTGIQNSWITRSSSLALFLWLTCLRQKVRMDQSLRWRLIERNIVGNYESTTCSGFLIIAADLKRMCLPEWWPSTPIAQQWYARD